MADHSIVGTWRLVGYEPRVSDGEGTYPWGRDPIGFIMYHPDGHMAVAILRRDRPRFESEDLARGTLSEKAAAAESYLTYMGRYTVEGNQVTHHVEACLFPNWTGSDQKRTFEVQGDRLTIYTPPRVIDGREQKVTLTWERAG